jgi:hypothetical protein
MRTKLLCIISVFCILFSVNIAKAELLTYEYTGVITELTDSPGMFGDNMGVGDTFRATVVLDDSIDYGPSINYTSHNVVSWTLSIADDKYVFHYNSTWAQQMIFEILNGTPGTNDFFDYVSVKPDLVAGSLPDLTSSSSVDPGFMVVPPPVGQDWSFRLNLVDESATTLTTADLLSSYPVSLFTDENRMSFRAYAVSGLDPQYSERFFYIDGEIATVDLIPTVPPVTGRFTHGAKMRESVNNGRVVVSTLKGKELDPSGSYQVSVTWSQETGTIGSGIGTVSSAVPEIDELMPGVQLFRMSLSEDGTVKAKLKVFNVESDTAEYRFEMYIKNAYTGEMLFEGGGTIKMD